MRIDVPKFVTTSEEYQKTPGSYVVNGGILNCTCGSLKNTVRLMIEDRGSDAGGSPICMDIDTKSTNFSQHFGKCSKTGEDCVLTSMNKKWHIPAKVPAYIKWIPKPKPRGKYTVSDTSLVAPIQIYPVILESSLVCWHNGSAGLITVDKNGQLSPEMVDYSNNINDNPQTGALVVGGAITYSAVAIAAAIVGMFIIAALLAYTWVQIQQLIQMGLIQIQFGMIQWTAEGIRQYNYYFGDKTDEQEKPKVVPVPKPTEGEEEKTGTDPPDISYPGDDPTVPPGEDWEWRGAGEPGTGEGSWYNPKTGESLHPDLNHPEPIGSHWDYQQRGSDQEFRGMPDGTWVPK